MCDIGISIYMSSGFEKNREIILHALCAKYIFTSLHIPEEDIKIEEIYSTLEFCKENNKHVICDISPRTLEKLNCNKIEELKAYGITHIRIDYGFGIDEIAKLSKTFNIVLNASTFTNNEYLALKEKGLDFSNFSACHNYYPKPLSGLSIDKVRSINATLHSYGIKVFGFVAGDLDKRGPLHLGLPTVEGSRNDDVLFNIMKLDIATCMDTVIIGDIDCHNNTWKQINEYSNGYISIPATLDKEYSILYDNLVHDRVDNSDFVIRLVESRGYATQGVLIPSKNIIARKKGTITIANERYLRYSGEIEICRVDLPEDEKVNVIGMVNSNYIKYLDYIVNGFGFKLIRPNY